MRNCSLEVRAENRNARRAGGFSRAADAVSVWLLIIAVEIIAGAFIASSPAYGEEVSVSGGEVFVGEGCVRVGNVVVGDCENGDGEEKKTAPPSGAGAPEDSPAEETTALGVSLREEPTSLEATTSESTTPEGSIFEVGVVCPTEPTGETRGATVERAIDGDTLEISGEVEGADRVRLIGVDSPETNATEEEARPEPGAAEATGFTADALEGGEVVLELGEDPKDDYGRLLAYVWTANTDGIEEDGFWSGLKRVIGMGESEMFNAALLAEGHAEILTIKPNDAYAECFEAAERLTASDEQYGETVLERTSIEDTVPEEMDPEQSIPENTASESLTPGEMGDEQTASGDEAAEGSIREPHAPESAEQSAPEETTVPEESLLETAPTEVQYEETTLEETVEAPTPEPPGSEGTSSAPEAPSEAAPDPAPSITLEPETSPELGAGELQSSEEETFEAPTSTGATVGTPEDIAESPALGTLPTEQTSEGAVSVLPDTGGAPTLSMLAGILGAVCIAVAFGLARLRRRSAPERW